MLTYFVQGVRKVKTLFMGCNIISFYVYIIFSGTSARCNPQEKRPGDAIFYGVVVDGNGRWANTDCLNFSNKCRKRGKHHRYFSSI